MAELKAKGELYNHEEALYREIYKWFQKEPSTTEALHPLFKATREEGSHQLVQGVSY
jgi:hypothetical protein